MVNIFSDIKISEYRLMYYWGAWITSKIINAETDAEAIFDADEFFENSTNLKNWRGNVVLFCGNRKVKIYN